MSRHQKHALLLAAALVLVSGLAWAWHGNKRRLGPMAEAVRETRLLAEKGDARAQDELGIRYAQGRGVPQADAEAVRWFRQAAEQGYARAQANLASAFYYGRGVPQSHAEAVRWARLAAEQGDPEGQQSLGVSYSEGQGVQKDEAEAARWFRRAADQEYSMAQTSLGYMYANGRGVPQDYSEAFRWCRKAAEQGDAMAQSYLGFSYSNGRGVSKDFEKSVGWYRKAAEQGDMSALKALVGISRRRRSRLIFSWPTIIVVVASLLILAPPQRLRKGKVWLSWALTFVAGAGMVAREFELLSFGFSMAMLRLELMGVFNGSLGRAVVMVGFSGLSAFAVVQAAREFVRGLGNPSTK